MILPSGSLFVKVRIAGLLDGNAKADILEVDLVTG
jgi:hypothetical protein